MQFTDLPKPDYNWAQWPIRILGIPSLALAFIFGLLMGKTHLLIFIVLLLLSIAGFVVAFILRNRRVARLQQKYGPLFRRNK